MAEAENVVPKFAGAKNPMNSSYWVRISIRGTWV